MGWQVLRKSFSAAEKVAWKDLGGHKLPSFALYLCHCFYLRRALCLSIGFFVAARDAA